MFEMHQQLSVMYVTEGVNKPVEIIRSVVEKNGTRAVDTGMFTISRKFKIEKGYKFQYIQDVVSPKFLVGLWNMEHNTRDESGHDIDGDETTSGIHQGSFANDANGYVYKNGSSGRCIKIPRAGQISHFDHLKFDGQFDIIILGGDYYGSPNSTTGFLLGKGSSATSIQIKTVSGGSNSTAMVITAVLVIGGSTYTLTGTTNVNRSGNTYGSGGMQDFYWIRLKRDSNNLVSLIVNDNVEDTEIVAGDFTTNDDLFIAGDREGNNILDDGQKTAQVRIYSGYSLTDAEWNTLRSARRPTEIMKFGGTVWKIDEKLTHKICYCKGLSDKLHNITVTTGNNSYPAWTTGDADIVKNEYYDKDGKAIIEDLLKVYGLGMNVADTKSSGHYLDTVYPTYYASGSILDNITLLHFADGSSDISFHITPRGTLFLETDNISHTEILFRQGALSRFSNFGYDDTNLITQLTLIGNVQTIQDERKFQGGDWSSSVTSGYGYAQTSGRLAGFPLTMEVWNPSGTKLISLHEKQNESNPSASSDLALYHRVLDGSGDPIAAATGEFKVDYKERRVYLGDDPASSSSNWTFKYTYQNTFSNNIFWTQKGTNYDILGNYSKTWSIPHFQGTYPLSSIASRVNTRLGSLERRVHNNNTYTSQPYKRKLQSKDSRPRSRCRD